MSRPTRRSVGWAFILAGFAASRSAAAQDTFLISVDSSGAEGNLGSDWSSISADGRFVMFSSEASNLVSGDKNGKWDVFVRDLKAGTTERVSVDTAGIEGNDVSMTIAQGQISSDGSRVVFLSYANLVAQDTNGYPDVFVRDRANGTTERVSVDSSGGQYSGLCLQPRISSDGNFVCFASYSPLVPNDNNGCDVFVHDLTTGATERVSVDSSGGEANASSSEPSISSDGRFVAFYSDATNLVANDGNNVGDVFLHDRWLGTTERVSIASSGVEGDDKSINPSVSTDGNLVAFESAATNFVANDTNSRNDVFVRDLGAETTSLVSADSAGVQGNSSSGQPVLFPDGRNVGFSSLAWNLVAGDFNNLTSTVSCTTS